MPNTQREFVDVGIHRGRPPKDPAKLRGRELRQAARQIQEQAAFMARTLVAAAEQVEQEGDTVA